MIAESARERKTAAVPTVYLARPIKTCLAFYEKSSGAPPSRGRRRHWPKTSSASSFPPPPPFGIGRQQRSEQVPKRIPKDSTQTFFFFFPKADLGCEHTQDRQIKKKICERECDVQPEFGSLIRSLGRGQQLEPPGGLLRMAWAAGSAFKFLYTPDAPEVEQPDLTGCSHTGLDQPERSIYSQT